MYTVHISDVFEAEEDDDDVLDEDITTILEEPNMEIPQDISGPEEIQKALRRPCYEFLDIFSSTVRSGS